MARVLSILLVTLSLAAALAPEPVPAQTGETTLDGMLHGGELDAKLTERTRAFYEFADTARTVLYVIASFMFIGIGVGGWFGRWNWRWMVAGLGGCAVIALSGYIVGALFVDDTTTSG